MLDNNLLRILVVDDEKNMRLSLKMILEKEQYFVETRESADHAMELLKENSFDLIIVDARMPGMSGYEFLKKVKTFWPEIAVIMITAYGTAKLAVEAVKNGVFDYLTKPFDPEELLIVIKRALQFVDLAKENAALRSDRRQSYGVDRLTGQNEKIEHIRNLVKTIANTSTTVLILGASGTGKELIARAIHFHSDRNNGPFISINCAALPESLLESELFGHEKGAFTGALQIRKGKFELADKGTLFLDEIGDMPLSLQSKILRVLQEKEFERLGGEKLLTTDVRIIAATNQNIPKLIQSGKFREDLFFRLNVMHIELPLLKERKEDIPILAYHFLKHYAQMFQKSIRSISDFGMKQLVQYDWPGNIRELQNVIERAVVLETSNVLNNINLLFNPAQMTSPIGGNQPEVGNFKKLVENYEKQLILSSMKQNSYKVTKAAEALGLTRHSLRHHIQRLFGDIPPWEESE